MDRRERRRPAIAVFLPDDVVLEILVRVKDSPAALFRCATACKRWHRLVADSSFLRRCWPEQALVGFFPRGFCPRGPLCFVPAPPRSLPGGHRRLLDPLVHAASAGLLKGAVPLVSRHGLLLVRLNRHSREATTVQLAVCDLPARAIHELPPVSCKLLDYSCWSGYALLTGADCGSNNKEQPPPPSSSSSFKVVIIDPKFKLHAFSSDEAGWSSPTECLEVEDAGDDFEIDKPFCHGDAVIHRGTAHWLISDWGVPCPCLRTIEMDAQNGHVSVTELSLPSGLMLRPHLSLGVDGMLTVIYISMRMGVPELEIWGRRQGDTTHAVEGTSDSDWLCTRKINLKQPGKKIVPQNMSLNILGEKCGTMFISDSNDRVYVVDLKAEVMEEVVDWPHTHLVTHLCVVPLEVDWAAIFVSRLGIWNTPI